MAQDDLDEMLRRGPDRSLDGLEARVWDGVAAARQADRRWAATLSLQAGLIILAVGVSAVAGGVSARRYAEARGAELAVFSPDAGFAPSSRLTGRG